MNEMIIHLLLNPIAGNGKANKAFERLKALLQIQEISFDYQISNYPGHLIELARNYADHQHSQNERLVVIGGDGSLNEVLNGIKESTYPQTRISYLPAGSGNDFARAAHLTKNPKVFISNLLNNDHQAEKVDCIKYTDNENMISHYFVNNLGIGFDAFIVYQSNHQRMKSHLNKLHLGNFIYTFNILSVLKKQDTFSIEVTANDQIYKFDNVYFATTTNHPFFGGGVPIEPNATIYSHFVDLVIVQKSKLAKFIWMFGKILTTRRHTNDPLFHSITAKKINLKTFKPEYAQIDGEDHSKKLYDLTYQIDSFYIQR